MRRRLGFPKLLDLYVTRISVGSFLVCFFFIVGLFVLIDLLQHVGRFSGNIERLPDEYRRLGFFLVVAYYLTFLPFIYMMCAPFITVTAGMFAVSRLMGANEVVPMLFTGRRLSRVLLPVFCIGVFNAVAMVSIRQFLLPRVVTAKDNLYDMIRHGEVDRPVSGKIISLPEGRTLFIESYWAKSGRIAGLRLRMPSADPSLGADSISAASAEWVDDHAGGPGWRLTEGTRFAAGSHEGQRLTFLPAAQVEGFTPVTLRNRIKESQELMDLSYTALVNLVRDQPTVLEYTVALHHHLTFPLANILLLILALPFALRFERGSKTERVFFALLVCAAYLVADLVAQNLGKQGLVHPVLAAWGPTVLFGSLGIVMFDTVRT